jgi:hypothetical protein
VAVKFWRRRGIDKARDVPIQEEDAQHAAAAILFFVADFEARGTGRHPASRAGAGAVRRRTEIRGFALVLPPADSGEANAGGRAGPTVSALVIHCGQRGHVPGRPEARLGLQHKGEEGVVARGRKGGEAEGGEADDAAPVAENWEGERRVQVRRATASPGGVRRSMDAEREEEGVGCAGVGNKDGDDAGAGRSAC